MKGETLESAGLDNNLMEMCLRVLASEGSSEELIVIEKIVIAPHPFVNNDTPALLIALATFRLQELTFTLPISSPSSLQSAIRLISQYTTSTTNAQSLLTAEAGVIEIFEVAEGLIESNGMGDEEARIAWEQLTEVGGEELGGKTMDKVRRHLLDTESLAS